MTAIFDLEQQMLEFANVTTDIEMLNRHFTEDPKWEGMSGELCDAILNKYGAIQELYEIQQVWGDSGTVRNQVSEYVGHIRNSVS